MTDHKAEFSRATDDILKRYARADTSELAVEIERLVDAYMAQTGERPESGQLERLTDLLLKISDREAI